MKPGTLAGMLADRHASKDQERMAWLTEKIERWGWEYESPDEIFERRLASGWTKCASCPRLKCPANKKQRCSHCRSNRRLRDQ